MSSGYSSNPSPGSSSQGKNKMDQEAGNELEQLTSLLDVEESDVKNITHNSKLILDFNMFDKENDNGVNLLEKPVLGKVSPHIKVLSKNTESNDHEKSEVHRGDTDSSDDEDNKNTSEQKYTETGREIKNFMKKQNTNSTSNPYTNSCSWKSNKSLFAPSTTATPIRIQPKDVYTDPYFGLRIITPLVSSQVLQERMLGKIPISFSKLQHHLAKSDKTNDWVIAGVIASKFVKTSQKGKPYVCWTLTDLKIDLKTVSLFLFGKAYQTMWKTSTHTVVAILNPTPLDNNKSHDIAALSVVNPDQVMIWGQSKDLGTCRARKKNGDACTAIVNKNQCDVCVYHLKQEHRKFTSRSELQAPSGGGLTQLRNKVLGKNEVFYAGRSYTAKVAKPAKKQVERDQKRLKDLFGQCESRLDCQAGSVAAVRAAPSARVQLMRDAQRLQMLTGTPATLNSLALENSHANRKPCDKNGGSINTDFKKSKREVAALEKPMLQSFTKAEEIKGLGKTNSAIGNSKPKPLEELKVHKHLEIKTSKSALRQQGSEQNRTNPKKQPTKNRFENLTKLESNKSKTNQQGYESDVSKAKKQTSKSDCLKPQSLIDVCFEFDEKPPLTKSQPENSNCVSAPSLKKASMTLKQRTTSTNRPPIDMLEESGLNGSKYCQEKESRLSKPTTPSAEGKTPKATPVDEKKVETPSNKPYTHSAVGKSSTSNQKSSPDFNDEQLGSFSTNSMKEKAENITTNTSIQTLSSRPSAAKLKALKYVQSKGPIVKDDPNERKNIDAKGSSLTKKRKRPEVEENENHENKPSLSKRFVELLKAESKHTDLITSAENKELDEYYDKMEKKEQLEEKMANTFKVDCKAVRCLKCNYKWFSAADRCKEENHPIKVISAVKRFFQCQNCKKRTVSLDVIPMRNCSGCNLSSWIRVPMLKERSSTNVHLSIRGGEQKFTNSVVTDANLDLLVPDDNP